MPSPTVENYLKALFALTGEEGKVSASEVGKSLGVSTPSVNSMVRKLSERGWVDYVKYQPLRLTEQGRKAAAAVIRKHRLTEMFLAEKMGFGWEEVHAIAEQIEHVESPAFFARMDELLGFPTVDPHGSPIPSASGEVQQPDLRSVADCRIGERVTVAGLGHSSQEFLHYLNERDISLSTTLEILGRSAFDGSTQVRIEAKGAHTLSAIASRGLLVR